MFSFNIQQKMKGSNARAGVIHTQHGDIETPALIVVGTKATVKAMTSDMILATGAQAVLANTYHLYLQPGDDIVSRAGGLHSFMNWSGPIFTDSGGFQVFSLGEAYGKKVSKIVASSLILPNSGEDAHAKRGQEGTEKLCAIDEEGVTFKSHIDGSEHRFTPEKSMQIQWNLGADIIFAFDECTSPQVPRDYQEEALARTHRWAEQSLREHKRLKSNVPPDDTRFYQAIFGVVQGGQYEDLRRESARTLGAMDFDGFGIGGSFTKDDIGTAVRWGNEELPEEKPRHLLGIGEPIDIFLAVEAGCDTFDCVIPTRLARHGHMYTKNGIVNLRNSKYRSDMSKLDITTSSPVSMQYTRAYISHLYHSHEMLASMIVSQHNIFFLVQLMKDIRQSIIDGNFNLFKENFLKDYYS